MHLNILNNNSDKKPIDIISHNIKLENIKENNLIKNKKEKGKDKEDSAFYFEGINSSISKNKFKNIISDKNLSSKKFCCQNTEQNTEKIFGFIEDKKNKSSNFFEKMLENKNTFKKCDLFAQQNEDINNIDNNSIQSINIHNNMEGKQLYTSKKTNNSNQKQIKIIIFFKKLFEKNNSKREDLFFSQNNNSFTRIIKMNNNDEEKTKICEIY